MSEVRLVYQLHFSTRAEARELHRVLLEANAQVSDEARTQQLIAVLGIESQSANPALWLEDSSFDQITVEALIGGDWAQFPSATISSQLLKLGCKLMACKYGLDGNANQGVWASATRSITRKQYEAALRKIDPMEEVWQLLKKKRFAMVGEMVTLHGMDPNAMVGPLPLLIQMLRTAQGTNSDPMPTDVIVDLLKAGAIVNPVTLVSGPLPSYDMPYFPLQMAAYTFDLRLIQALLDAGADVNEQSPSGCTPLHVLADSSSNLRSHPERATLAAELLLANGADLNHYSPEQGTPLASVRHAQLRELMLAHGATLELPEWARSDNMLEQQSRAVRVHDHQRFKELLVASPPTELERHKLLTIALREGNHVALDQLWRLGDHAFMSCIGSGTEADGEQLLAYYITDQAGMNEAMLQDLAERSRSTACPSFEGPLLQAAFECLMQQINKETPPAMASRLIEMGLPFDAPTNSRYHPFRRAVSDNNMEIVFLLLAKGVDPNKPIIDSANSLDFALHEAVIYRANSCIAPLLAAGADREVRNRRGLTPLELAIENKNKPAQKILLS